MARRSTRVPSVHTLTVSSFKPSGLSGPSERDRRNMSGTRTATPDELKKYSVMYYNNSFFDLESENDSGPEDFFGSPTMKLFMMKYSIGLGPPVRGC